LCWLVKVKLFNIFFGHWNIKTLGKFCNLLKAIYSASGQLYQPEDSDKVMWYKEDKKGQVLQEGINEAGAVSDSFITVM
jgi:pyruvate dehydrogenase complex dehydrogenase (E1) component